MAGHHNIPMQTTVSRGVKTQIQLHAFKEGVSPAAIIRRALLEWLAAHPIGPTDVTELQELMQFNPPPPAPPTPIHDGLFSERKQP